MAKLLHTEGLTITDLRFISQCPRRSQQEHNLSERERNIHCVFAFNFSGQTRNDDHFPICNQVFGIYWKSETSFVTPLLEIQYMGT